jgi:DNA-binding SARP family transcriptional activator
MQTNAKHDSPADLMLVALASAQEVAGRSENVYKTVNRLRLLSEFIWSYTESHGGKNVAFLPESERTALLPDATYINPSLQKIAEDLSHNTMRTALLKLISSKSVQDFLDAAERYDEWLETLQMSLNHEFIAALMSRMDPHIHQTENAI